MKKHVGVLEQAGLVTTEDGRSDACGPAGLGPRRLQEVTRVAREISPASGKRALRRVGRGGRRAQTEREKGIPMKTATTPTEQNVRARARPPRESSMAQRGSCSRKRGPGPELVPAVVGAEVDGHGDRVPARWTCASAEATGSRFATPARPRRCRSSGSTSRWCRTRASFGPTRRSPSGPVTTVTFEETAGKTRVVLRDLFSSKEARSRHHAEPRMGCPSSSSSSIKLLAT